MKKRLSMLIDVKSIITLSIIVMLAAVVIGGLEIEEKAFNLFSNVTTMVITYFFTKKSVSKGDEADD